MVFSGLPFLYYFLPLVLLLYFAVPGKGKNLVLLVSGLAFYAWGEQGLVFLFAGTILLGWLSGLALVGLKKGPCRNVIFVLAIGADLGLLGWFKYADFFLDNVNRLLGASFPLPEVALPIGISFYTFQLLSYTVDVYRGEVSARRNLIDFGAYVAMFPQLIAGPVVRYGDVADRLDHRRYTLEKTAEGVRRFLMGLGKKVLIANVLGEIVAAFHGSADLSVLYYWLYVIAFGLQMYFDFSGYSDMAIGLGKILGFDLPENFRYPYLSASITEFWRRWHITLGNWFRDYVYIPLGGNHRGLARQLLNILIVWLLTGLWHGASWNFVVWGLGFAVLLTAEKLGLKGFLDRHKVVGHLYVLTAVFLGFVLFDAQTITEAGTVISGLFGGFGSLPLLSVESVYCLRSNGPVLLLAAVGATPLPAKLFRRITETAWGEGLSAAAEPLGLAGLLLMSTACLVDGSFNPFLYFRF